MRRKLDDKFIASVEALAGLPGGDAFATLVDTLEAGEPSVGIRINRRKECCPVEDDVRVAWAVNGRYVVGERPKFTFDPAMHQGRYYVQDPSSMIMERIVADLAGDAPVVYIDGCAAPGGKTTAAISSLPGGSLVIANEYDRRRAEVLCENLTKWGYPDVVVSCGDTSRIGALGAIADIVAIDVPCSGEGMMRKDETAVEQWSPGLVAQCASLQREIIDNAWRALKPGGYLIYSTCTFNRSENEENVAYIAETYGAEPVDLHLSDRFPGISGAVDSHYPAGRFIPGRIDGEGLFVAVMRKPETPGCETGKVRKEKNGRKAQDRSSKPDVKLLKQAAGWIDGDGYGVMADGDRFVAVNARWEPLLAVLRKSLNVLSYGVEVATVKGRDLLPSQGLALSGLLRREAFAEVEVDYVTALLYLTRQAVSIEDAPRGIVLLTFEGHPLGFVKNLGNRANNLYPQGWAIRSTHLPEEPVKVLGGL